MTKMPSERQGTSRKRIVVLGIGNVLLSDEGVGVHIVNELSKMALPENVRFVDGGTEGFALLDVMEEADALVIVDAVRAGGDPGSIYTFDLDSIQAAPQHLVTSFHQIGLLDVLQVAELLGRRPRTRVVGVEPKTLEIGLELSPEVKARMQSIVETVLALVREEMSKA
jgi:hydrogenase maturation protease